MNKSDIRLKPQWEVLDVKTTNPEADLFNSAICEFTEITGFKIKFYVKLNYENMDIILGEDPNSTFSNGYETKAIYEVQQEDPIISSLGAIVDDTINYIQLPKEMFMRDIEEPFLDDHNTYSELKPKVGDAIRTLWNDRLYEIVEVSQENKIFQGTKMVWDFILRPFRYQQESTSAQDMVDDHPEIEDNPDINEPHISTAQLSAVGDNEEIEEQSDEIKDYGASNEDATFFGYDTLDGH